ncbi:MAG TPA: hypothetical protein VL002_18120 [Candidimonas sp.]|nr:hypothetical protein [Candidimonas sp.]
MDDQQKIMAMMVLAEDQQKAAQAAIDDLAKQTASIEQGAARAVRTAMLSVEEKTIDAFKDHGDAINESVEAAHGAAAAIKASIKGVGWKLAGVAFLAALGAVIAFAIAAYALVGWQSYQVASLAREKADLVQEVASLKAAAENFTKKAGKAQLTTCGDKGRLCVQVDQSFKDYERGIALFEGGYVIIKGY